MSNGSHPERVVVGGTVYPRREAARINERLCDLYTRQVDAYRELVMYVHNPDYLNFSGEAKRLAQGLGLISQTGEVDEVVQKVIKAVTRADTYPPPAPERRF